MAIPIRKDMAAIPRLSTAISIKRLQKGRSRAIESVKGKQHDDQYCQAKSDR